MSTKDEQFRAIYMHYMPLMRIIAKKKKIPEAEIGAGNIRCIL